MGFINFLNDRVFGMMIPILLIGTGIFFSLRLKFFHFLHPVRTARAAMRRGECKDGEAPVRALFMALAGTLGVGNITGVALAISAGGAGAVFWMWASALAAMIIRYAEIALALDERGKNVDTGGCATSYIQSAVGGRMGVIVGGVFAFLCLLCSFFLGGAIQSSVIAESLHEVIRLPKWSIGALVCCLSFFVIIGGGKKISAFTSKIVPVMTALYIIISLVVIIVKIDGIRDVIHIIFRDSFQVKSAGGGVCGFLFSRGVRIGVARGLISNEAGCGTAPMAHATSGDVHPAKQGIMGIFEVFIDTVLLCSLTAFVILLNIGDVPSSDGSGMMTVISAFSSVFGMSAGIIISVSIFFFAFATIICWAYYGQICTKHFSRSKNAMYSYTVIFCACLFFGSVAMPNFIWGMSDVLISTMTVINIFAIIIKADRVVTLSADFGLIKIKGKERGCEKQALHLLSRGASSCR